MSRVSSLLASTLALAAFTLAGCGAVPDPTSTSMAGFAAKQGHMRHFAPGGPGKRGRMGFGHHGGPGMGGPGMGGPGMGGLRMGGPGLPGLPLAGIELTTEQRASLKAIAEKYRPAEAARPDPATMAARRDEMKARQDALKAALSAEPFDGAALSAALAPPADRPAPPALDPQALVEARAVLTDEQRATVIAKLKEAPQDLPAMPGRPDPTARLTEALALTAEQQAKLAAIGAARPAPDHAARHAAMIAFLETGDAAALLTPPAHAAPPTDALVAFVGSLDAAQRAKLTEQAFFLGGPRGAGGPGGPGGFGHR